ncbi:MAG: alpha-mannosyltransferase [Alphaproteobacteria bacterium 64-11]|nr:glycosyltransferase family 1 protein [Alphaproteobacteria bacterium]OJU08267.1 MAG: alpha-mannosyltransferase [Alphaproteobacteria bacterium 64-11]
MKILIVTDAWAPQVNGVVRTLEMLCRDLGALGHTVRVVTPQGRLSMPLPTYPEIKLALFQKHTLKQEIRDFSPDAVHISTEGALGLTARRICLEYGIAFSTAFHTRFAEYVHARFPLVPESLVWRWLRWFHRPATTVMAATQSLRQDLLAHGFSHIRLWSRGVDVDRFRPIPGARHPFAGPIWLYVGRVAVEKNIEAFLALDLPGTKVVVGNGPAKAGLERKYPHVRFLGALTGEDLVRAYAGADVFVFPSRTDTFGLVMLEALASGLTVAAYPAEGPRDVVGGPEGARVAVLDEDLRKACLGALALRQEHPDAPRAFALTRSWRACTLQFLRNIIVEPDPD